MNGGTGAVSASRGGASDAISTEHSSGAGPVSNTWPLVSSLELAALPTAVACARLHARLVLGEWKLDHLVGDAMTLVSELLTNAVRATRSAGTGGLVFLRLLADGWQLLIEVWDQSPDDPKPQAVGHDAEHGRGFMVIETISNRWGYYRVNANLKVVWCELVVGGAV
jgi:anti-sigma regulatory factor (Ser/Thr protein kinase)